MATARLAKSGGIIPAMGFGLEGGSYSVLDREGDNATRYWLVEIDNRGREMRHGPFLVDRPAGPRQSRVER